jgi:hypothetical protein
MSTLLRIAVLIAIVAVAGIATMNLIGRGPVVGSAPTPALTQAPTQAPTTSPSASPMLALSPSPTAATPSPGPLSGGDGGNRNKARSDGIDIGAWTEYRSARYPLAIRRPAGWTVRPSDHVWTLAKDAAWDNTASDSFIAPDGTVRVSAWSVAVKPGTKLTSWIATYCAKNTRPCTGIQDRATPVYAERWDRHPGILVPFDGDVQAFFMNGDDRVWIVAIWRPESDPSVMEYGGARRLLEAFALSLFLGAGA